MVNVEESSMTTLLVTGGSGFIGSNFILHMLSTRPDYRIINLDKLTYASSQELIQETALFPQYSFVHGSIENQELVDFIFWKYDIRGVIHFAAESHVDNSIENPGVFVQSNIVGTFTLLNAAQRYWMDGAWKVREGYKSCRFQHISTDEVYGTLENKGKFTEESNYAPNSPYSASKASSDLIARSFQRTYGLNVVITNCSNNYGPRQHKEKLIPTIIRSALQHKPIPIYGTGCNVRDWLHVQDHVEAIDLVFHNGSVGETYNIGSDNEWTNLELAHEICTILDEQDSIHLKELGLSSYSELIQLVEDRPGHDWRYAIDCSKIHNELGWQARIPFRVGLKQTIDWYRVKFLEGLVKV